MTDTVERFFRLYRDRPLSTNVGGIRVPQALGLFAFLERIDPTYVVESGVFQGQSTWLIETACPEARILSIDIDLAQRRYTSPRAAYSDIDFRFHDHGEVDPDRAVAFFDDHVNAYDRLVQARHHGFRWAILEDNYPPGQGDTPSLEQFRAGAGMAPEPAPSPTLGYVKHRIKARLGRADRYEPSTLWRLCERMIDSYEVYPPILTLERTRWGTPWAEAWHEPPLFAEPDHIPWPELRRLAVADAASYTGIALVRLR